MPIRMYIILIGAFFMGDAGIVVLTQKTKLTTMETIDANLQNPNMFNLGELLDACRKGDHKAQFQIYRLYYKTMFNICLAIINDPGEAEDIMQESFLKAFEAIETYNGSENFDNWLGRMVLNRATDFRNRNSSLFFNW